MIKDPVEILLINILVTELLGCTDSVDLELETIAEGNDLTWKDAMRLLPISDENKERILEVSPQECPRLCDDPSEQQVRDYLKALADTGYMYHLDDDLDDIESFTEEEQAALHHDREKAVSKFGHDFLWNNLPEGLLEEEAAPVKTKVKFLNKERLFWHDPDAARCSKEVTFHDYEGEDEDAVRVMDEHSNVFSVYPKELAKKVHVMYENIDSMNRPVFRELRERAGDTKPRRRFGCIDELFPYQESEAGVLKKVKATDLCFFGSEFDCEPHGSYADVHIVKEADVPKELM